MKIQFNVDRVGAFRAGVNTSGEVVTLDLDPSSLAEADRTLLAGAMDKDGKIQWFSPNCYNSKMITAKLPNLESLLEAIRTNLAEIAKVKENEVQQKEKHRLEALAVLETRKVKVEQKVAGVARKNGVATAVPYSSEISRPYQAYTADFGYHAPSEVTDSPEAIAWKAELKQKTKAAEQKALDEAMEALQAKIDKENAALEEMVEWINTHGSKRLRRCVEENIECEAAYQDERLAKERRGWVWAKEVDGDYREARNPSEQDFDTLDQARQTAPDARLVFWEDGDENSYYFALAEFLGREIVFDVPSHLIDDGEDK